jgi:hypothetical protein
MSDEPHEPKVGYGQPPPATRFKPGQSGNPKGRPKAAKNFATALSEELNGLVAVTENGKRRKLTRRQVIAKQMVNKATNGDTKVLPILFNEIRQHDDHVIAGHGTSDASPEEKAVMEGILGRLRLFDAARGAPPQNDSEAGPAADSSVAQPNKGKHNDDPEV